MLQCSSLTSHTDDVFEIEEDGAESGKSGYVNFKRVVWHKSFFKVLESIHKLSKIGFNIKCADGETRLLYLAILMLSADYEEQYALLCMSQFNLTSIVDVSWLSFEVQTAISLALYVLYLGRECVRVQWVSCGQLST